MNDLNTLLLTGVCTGEFKKLDNGLEFEINSVYGGRVNRFTIFTRCKKFEIKAGLKVRLIGRLHTANTGVYVLADNVEVKNVKG